MVRLFQKVPSLPLGVVESRFFRRSVALPLAQLATHMHVIGVSGSGKSRFLAHLYLSLIRGGYPATLLDPHGDLAQLVLEHLVAAGTYRDPAAFERIVYLDLPAAERAGRFLPFNVLAQHGADDAVAANVKEAFHRAWPELAQGAATFDTLLPDAVLLLIHRGLPLTAMHQLLIDDQFREVLLAREQDRFLVASFRHVYDRLRKADQVSYAGSVLRRARQLTQSRVLRYGLGQQELALDYRRIMDTGQSVIVNLALPNPDARRLLGCFIAVAAELGALSRAELPPNRRGGTHHLVMDEAFEQTAQSEEALARILSQTRKFGMYLVMAHQTWSQASSDRLRGAMQNVGLEVIFRLGRDDAVHTAAVLGRADPLAVKHEAPDEGAQQRGHPVFYSLAEQWEALAQQAQDLPPRRAFIKPAHGAATLVRTVEVPDPAVRDDELAAVQGKYLATYFRPQAAIDRSIAQHQAPPAASTPVVSGRRKRLLEGGNAMDG